MTTSDQHDNKHSDSNDKDSNLSPCKTSNKESNKPNRSNKSKNSNKLAKSPKPKRDSIQLSLVESIVVGAIGGTIETSLQMPLITWKICVQEGRRFPRKPLEWYRGVFINAGSLSPITALQCYANAVLERRLTLKSGRKLSDFEKLICSGTAGALSGIIYGPVDLLVIQQQKFVASLPATFRKIANAFGARRVFRGLQACMTREAIYTMGYLGLGPVVNNRLLSLDGLEFFKKRKMFTSFFSACVAGTFAALLTHPVDTSKTCVQSDLVGDKYPNARWTMLSLYQKGGVKTLYKGFTPRTMRLCGAFFVLQQVREKMIDFKAYRMEKRD